MLFSTPKVIERDSGHEILHERGLKHDTDEVSPETQ